MAAGSTALSSDAASVRSAIPGAVSTLDAHTIISASAVEPVHHSSVATVSTTGASSPLPSHHAIARPPRLPASGR